MMWRVLGLVELDRIYPLDVLAVILVQGKISRLFPILLKDKKLVSYINANNIKKDKNILYISLITIRKYSVCGTNYHEAYYQY
ncbi:MAG: hypothetical protein ACQZ3N_03400 [cyanobacterium endosymbiont of Rhopalodia yunnanensis]